MTTTAIITFIAIIIILLVIFFVVKKRSKKITTADTQEGDQIYVGNLAYRASEKDLRQYFERYGEIRNVRVIRDQNTGRSRGFAFVTYGEMQQAEKALEAHGQDLFGRAMVVRIAKSR